MWLDRWAGPPLEPPLSAGGRIGEWLTGTYAALGAIAAYREAVRSGLGEHVDVAMLDCMAVTMVTCPSVFASFLGWPPLTGPGRTVEVPSVEPTSDGFAVFTTNSAQQFQDFLIMIGRPDLLDDPDLPSAVKRFARRDEFRRGPRLHPQNTTAEVLEDASLFRIPAGPVLNGSTIPDFEQFVTAGFRAEPLRTFRPAPGPVRHLGHLPRPFGHAPGNGEHTESFVWAEPTRPKAEPEDGRSWQLPLAGLASWTALRGGPARRPPACWPTLAPT